MRGKRGLPSCRRRLGSRSALYDTDRAAPILEEVEDVSLAELDPHWTPSGGACLHTLAVSVDAATRNRQRHAALGPAAHLFERRPDDPHEVAAVLPTEVGLERAAILRKVCHRLETIKKGPVTKHITAERAEIPEILIWLCVLSVLCGARLFAGGIARYRALHGESPLPDEP
jgi:hypothetical protein